MKRYLQIILSSLVGTLLLAFVVSAQVAGNPPYTIEQSVIASGGGTSSNTTGGAFSITGTIGQSIAGTTSTNSPFTLRSGFFAPDMFAPSAATVTIQGNVRRAVGRGLRNVIITLTEANGTTRTAISGFSGEYSFTDVEVGQMIILNVSAKRFNFSEPTIVLNLTEEVSGIDFITFDQISEWENP